MATPNLTHADADAVQVSLNLADSALQPEDLASGAITTVDGDLDLNLVTTSLQTEWWDEQPASEIIDADISTLRAAQTVESLGEGTALVLPARSGVFFGVLTDDGTIQIARPQSGEIEQRLTLLARQVQSTGAAITTQDSYASVEIVASTAPRTIAVVLGGIDAVATLDAELGDDSATVAPLALEFTGQEERRVLIAFAAGETSTLTLTLTKTSDTDTDEPVYISSIELVGPSGSAGDPLLTMSIDQAWVPQRVDLTAGGKQDWALYDGADTISKASGSGDIGCSLRACGTSGCVTSMAGLMRGLRKIPGVALAQPLVLVAKATDTDIFAPDTLRLI